MTTNRHGVAPFDFTTVCGCDQSVFGQFVMCQVRANETYLEANRQLGVRDKDALMNADSPHQWWSTPKSAVFGSSSSLPPLVGGGGGLVCQSVGKADLLSCHFESATHVPSVS